MHETEHKMNREDFFPQKLYKENLYVFSHSKQKEKKRKWKEK